MNYTTEDLKSIYIQSTQYATAKYGSEPDRIEIYSDYMLRAVWTAYSREYDDEYIEFTMEDLSKDLEQVYKERKEREAEEAHKRKIYEDEQRKRNEQIKKSQRLSEYLKLKKEFE